MGDAMRARRDTRARRVGASAAAATLTTFLVAMAPQPAAAILPPRDVAISYYLTRDGAGELIANPTPDGWGFVSWAQCPPGGAACAPVRSTGWVLRVPPATAAGTRFQATSRGNGLEVTRTSDPWLGPPRSLAPPRAIGRLRVGSLVRPVPGTWAGGWGDEKPILQLQACPRRDERGCEVVSATFYWDQCPGTGAVLGRRYVGWYLRVADNRWAREPMFAAYGVFRPSALRPYTEGPTTAIAVAGRIGPARGRPAPACGAAPPLVSTAGLPARIRRGAPATLARVRCDDPCDVAAEVRQGRRRLVVRRRLVTGILRLSPRQTRSLRRGSASLRLIYAGRRQDTRRLRVA